MRNEIPLGVDRVIDGRSAHETLEMLKVMTIN